MVQKSQCMKLSTVIKELQTIKHLHGKNFGRAASISLCSLLVACLSAQISIPESSLGAVKGGCVQC